MSPFLSGAILGVVCAGALFLAFLTHMRPRARQSEPQWDDPFDEPAPQIVTTHKLIRERTFQ